LVSLERAVTPPGKFATTAPRLSRMKARISPAKNPIKLATTIATTRGRFIEDAAERGLNGERFQLEVLHRRRRLVAIHL
jgi:hypothetical protein